MHVHVAQLVEHLLRTLPKAAIFFVENRGQLGGLPCFVYHVSFFSLTALGEYMYMYMYHGFVFFIKYMYLYLSVKLRTIHMVEFFFQTVCGGWHPAANFSVRQLASPQT